ncbi:MAG: Fe-S cluster assembly protein SufD [Sulfuricella sp.]|nr:Fe-S cluster assembly protein SufD [Sulfuricella sp.]
MNAQAPYLIAPPLPEQPQWLDKRRQSAFLRFLEDGLPTPRNEEWKYTSLAHLETAPLHPPAAGGAEAPAATAYPGQVLAFGDGRLVARQARPPAKFAAGLAEAAQSATVRRHLGQVTGSTAALAWLNLSMWRDGAYVHVPASISASAPLFLSFATRQADTALHPRNLVVLEAGARLVLVEHYHSELEARYWQNAVSEIILGEGAHLTHLKITEEGQAATHTGLTAVIQERDSRYQSLSVSSGGRLARHDLTIQLRGAGASARLDGLFIAAGRSHVDHHLRIEHLAPHTASRATYRGIAAGRGQGVFDGHIVVTSAGQHADAALSSRNLLLSPYAEIDAKPQLEIYADQVKCGHGVTVGQLDEAQLFYLESRGIAADSAYTLLLRAFADESLGLLKETGLAAWLEPRLHAGLPRHTPKGSAS